MENEPENSTGEENPTGEGKPHRTPDETPVEKTIRRA